MDRIRKPAVLAPVFAVLLLMSAGRAFAQGQVLESRPVKKGYKRSFTINSSPQQATIFVDDRKYGVVGYTPFKVTLVDGDYKIILELKGYKTEERNLRVGYGIADQLVVLQREIAPGMLKVLVADPNVGGARLVVDGQVQGPVPQDVKVAVGRHLVEISKEGFLPFSQWVEVEEGQVIALAPVLRPVEIAKPQGSLLVDSTPSGADVAIDGRKISDKTPTVVDQLTEGVHVLEVSKPPAKAFKDTIYIKAGERTKLTAKLEEPPPPPEPAKPVEPVKPPEPAKPEVKAPEKAPEPTTGSLSVKANVEGAEVLLDGEKRGAAPLVLKDLKAGPHELEVRAPKYTTARQKVEIEAGKETSLEVSLPLATPEPAPVAPTGPTAPPGKSNGLVRVISPVPEATVFIDGAKAGVSPVERELAAGKHFVVVTKEGFADFAREILVEVGATTEVTATLAAGGSIRVIANREGAQVALDGKLLGPSPAEANGVEIGEHLITVTLSGYEEYRTKVLLKGGAREIVNADLRLIDTGPTPEQLKIRQRSISTWGARPMAFGNFAVDLSAGYPVWTELRATVGVSDANMFGWDMGLMLRSYTNNWDILLNARMRFIQTGPFSVGLFGVVGGGAGETGRNSFAAQLGGLASLNFADLVTITARVFADIWSDQLCPADGTAGMNVCQNYPAGRSNVEEAQRVEKMIGMGPGVDLTKRNTAARAYLSLTLEAAIVQNFSLFLVVEGAPAQGERAMHSNLFNRRMLGEDPIYNGRIGATFKY